MNGFNNLPMESIYLLPGSRRLVQYLLTKVGLYVTSAFGALRPKLALAPSYYKHNVLERSSCSTDL